MVPEIHWSQKILLVLFHYKYGLSHGSGPDPVAKLWSCPEVVVLAVAVTDQKVGFELRPDIRLRGLWLSIKTLQLQQGLEKSRVSLSSICGC